MWESRSAAVCQGLSVSTYWLHGPVCHRPAPISTWTLLLFCFFVHQMRDFLHWCADIFSHLQTLRRVTHASWVTISWALRWRPHAGHCDDVILLQHQFLWVYTPISWLEPPSIWLLWTASATFSFKKMPFSPWIGSLKALFYTNFHICIPHSLVPSSSAYIHSVLLTLNLSLSDFSPTFISEVSMSSVGE